MFRNFVLSCLFCTASSVFAAPTIIDLYPDGVPHWNEPSGPERDTSNDKSRASGGNPIIRLGDVHVPQLHVYHPATGPADSMVIICPGGGFHILAWDFEGTELAEWFNTHGVSAAVLKYRVPTAQELVKYEIPVADCRRAIDIVRSGQTGNVPKHLGLMGFSAGGQTVAQTIFGAAAENASGPVGNRVNADFGILVYPAYMIDPDNPSQLIPTLTVSSNSPPMFFAHAADDQYSSRGSTIMHGELIRNKVPSEIHVFAGGGHGFGGRSNNRPVDIWLDLCAAWMIDSGFAPRTP